MIIERTNDEIIIRLPIYMDTPELSRLVNLLRYKSATARSAAKQKDVDELCKEIKKGRGANRNNKD